MNQNLDLPFLRDEFIEEKAEEFLAKHHPRKSLPIPIELIVEGIGIDIIPFNNLKNWDVFGKNSALTPDLRYIYVDEWLCDPKANGNYFRFSLAHELGHICLHADIYKSFPIKSPLDWKNTHIEIPEWFRSRLEYQANVFAGYVLVPRSCIKTKFSSVKDDLINEGIDPDDEVDLFEQYLSERLSREFQVSNEVIKKRISKDSLSIIKKR